MSLALRLLLVPVLVAAAAIVARAPDPASAPLAQADVAIGSVVPDLGFTDERRLPRRLSELGASTATVVVFTTVDCPIVARYLPRLSELEARYRDRGVRFLALDVGRGDEIVEIAQQRLDSGCSFPFGKDQDGDVVRALGATRTPEVCVLDAERRLVYRGRVDSQYRFGGARPDAGRADLERALLDLLEGRPVEVPSTSVDGCLIEDLAPAARYAAYADLASVPPRTALTWAKDVAPIVRRACQDCHHDGTVAPFPLVEYRDVARRAAMVAEVVRDGRMPPWFASPEHGEFVNSRRLSAEERDTLVAWALAGAPRGDAADEPPAPVFDDTGWRIGEPDEVVVQAVATQVPADGYVPYQYVMLPRVFFEDTWVEAVEIRPDDRRVVHHANLAHVKLTEKFRESNFMTGYVPGGDPLVCDPGTALRIPAGSVLGLQVHLVTVGEPRDVRISVGLRFARGVVDRELHHFQIHDTRFAIPPGAPAHEVRAARTFRGDATGIGMFCHMHLRGRDMAFRATRPDGSQEPLLVVPNYDFDWQQSYRWAPGTMRFPAGTRVDVVAHFDNSPFNPYNPDPTATVRNGEQTYQEMMYGFLFFTHDDERLGLRVDPANGRVVGERGGSAESSDP
ncbi:MAG: redoxin family protein [Planctomycetota bacterium]